jgi:hypothetical protein
VLAPGTPVIAVSDTSPIVAAVSAPAPKANMQNAATSTAAASQPAVGSGGSASSAGFSTPQLDKSITNLQSLQQLCRGQITLAKFESIGTPHRGPPETIFTIDDQLESFTFQHFFRAYPDILTCLEGLADKSFSDHHRAGHVTSRAAEAERRAAPLDPLPAVELPTEGTAATTVEPTSDENPPPTTGGSVAPPSDNLSPDQQMERLVMLFSNYPILFDSVRRVAGVPVNQLSLQRTARPGTVLPPASTKGGRFRVPTGKGARSPARRGKSRRFQ